MTFALNLTLPIKQDAETQAKLNGLADAFETKIQPAIQEALKKSQIVHFARVVVIDNKYIQVLTEFDGEFKAYAEFFRRALTPVFAAIFSLAEGAPDVTDVNGFWEYVKNHNPHSLGKSPDGAKNFDGSPAGYLFSAYDQRTVKEILQALNPDVLSQAS
jgi:hypothetical protein